MQLVESDITNIATYKEKPKLYPIFLIASITQNTAHLKISVVVHVD
jgi:hypothetical protein